MGTVRISIPAVISDFGPATDSMGLAVGLHSTVELSELERGLEVIVSGYGEEYVPRNPRNLIVQGAIALFRHVGVAPSGLSVFHDNNIPIGVGLGGSTASLTAGVVSANVLLGAPLQRDELLELILNLEAKTNSVVTALDGGLIVSSTISDCLIHAPSPVAPMEIGVIVPSGIEAERYRLPDVVKQKQAVEHVGTSLLLAQAFRLGDYDLLAWALNSSLVHRWAEFSIPGYGQAREHVREAGGTLTISGQGPAIALFTETKMGHLASDVSEILYQANADSALIEHWVLPVDRQGISISEVGTFDHEAFIPVPATKAPVPKVTDHHLGNREENLPSIRHHSSYHAQSAA